MWRKKIEAEGPAIQVLKDIMLKKAKQEYVQKRNQIGVGGPALFIRGDNRSMSSAIPSHPKTSTGSAAAFARF